MAEERELGEKLIPWTLYTLLVSWVRGACAQDALPHALVQVWDRVGQAVRAAAGSRVLLPAGQTSATAAVAAAVWSRCLKIKTMIH